MTCQFFKGLSCSVQAAIIEEKGVYLTFRTNSILSVFLYQVDAFYVEAYFLHKEDRLMGIKSFEGTDRLDPYLKNIDLNQLMADS